MELKFDADKRLELKFDADKRLEHKFDADKPDYGQSQGLGAEEEFKSSEKGSDGTRRERTDGQTPE